MKLVKKDLNLECSVLTSDQIRELNERVQSCPGDHERKRVDFQLLDATIECLNRTQMREYVSELRKSIKRNNKITKQFYHHENTVANFDHYLDESVTRPSSIWMINFKVAIRIAKFFMRLEGIKLKPVKIEVPEDQLKVWTNMSASAGSIGSGSKRDNVNTAFETFMRMKTGIANGTPYDLLQIPALPAHRAQIGHYVKNGVVTPNDVILKDRLVWIIDAATVTLEGQYAKPLIQHLMRSWYSYVGGDGPSELRLKIIYAFQECRTWSSIDFSKFDQTIQSWLIVACFDLIKSVFDEEYWDELDFICYNFIHTKMILRTPNGPELVQKHRGIPSGSNFTQVVGSMANMIVQLTYLASRYDGSFEEKVDYVMSQLNPERPRTFFMGDDNLSFVSSPVDIVDMAKYVDRVFGMTIHPEKTESSKDFEYPVFLKREWHPEGEYREFLDLMVNVIHPERDRSYDNYSPWHILYGLFLSYYVTWKDIVSEDFLLQKMHANGGIDPLFKLDYNELPGSLKAFGYMRVPFLVERAKALQRTGHC